ncbi:uncharacterized protein NEMAJ01_0757 [Nematocida major]|uniref:uncharacterized protein n=1 Tax=Nematocida major TaxID=1912982 RepID=UPI0020074636|nr:uncharacterized protein NEMAJ01_0757 [Nematocida major]KAH9385861.1 hypothetical protein NEMAJ01_0757 [Nematocida major]
MHGMWRALLMGTVQTLAKIVLLDDIDAPEKHGYITIDSTNNKIDHISRKIRSKKASLPAPPDGYVETRKYTERRFEPVERASIGGSTPRKVVHVEEEPFTVDLGRVPVRRVYAPIDRRIEGLLLETDRIKKEQDKYDQTRSKIRTRKIKLKTLKSDRKLTEKSIYLTHKEINAVENALESLKLQLAELNGKFEAISRQESEIEKDLVSLQGKLNEKAALLHRLHRLKKKYRWLQSEYSYYESESSGFQT